MTEPIIGLKIDVPGQELIDWLRARAAEHDMKAKAYGQQAKSIGALQAQDDEIAAYSNSPTHSLAQSAQQHDQKGLLLTFMADHLDASATYRLDQQDMVLAEILNRGW